MKRIIIPILCLLSVQILLAQENTASVNARWGVKAGWTEGYTYDEHTSPLFYQYDVMNIGGMYQRQGAFLLDVSLTLKIGTNRPKQLGHRTGTITETPDIYGHIESYEIKAYPFFSMVSGDLKVRALWQLSGGHQLGASLNARHIYTGMAIDDWHYTQLDIAPEYQFSYRLLRGDLTGSFSLPLLAGVVRPNYAFDPSLPDLTNYYRGYLRTSSSLVSLNKLFSPRFRAGYTWHFSSGESLGASYFAAWTSYPDPRPMRMFENGIEVTYFFK
ncbi:MAG: hypothetical protein MI974_02345 [Chitinophagales bacterium]|nr:hypothetical protein [Chitinophagales bacterium]